jgi:hypothetical protein
MKQPFHAQVDAPWQPYVIKAVMGDLPVATTCFNTFREHPWTNFLKSQILHLGRLGFMRPEKGQPPAGKKWT